MFKVQINIDERGFVLDPFGTEVRDLLNDIRKNMLAIGETEGELIDPKGNFVGHWEYID